MGKKFNKLIAEAKQSGKVIPYSKFKATTVGLPNVSIYRYDETIHYHLLACTLPDFIRHYQHKRLRLNEKFKKDSLGKKLSLLNEQKSKVEILKELLFAIDNCNNKTVKRYFAPKNIMISAPAKEQYDDFMRKYYQLQKNIININNNPKVKFKRSIDEIVKRIPTDDAKRIFQFGKYDENLFYEYLEAKPSFTDLYIAAGLEKYRINNLNFKSRGINRYTKAIEKLHSKQKNIGFIKTIRGLILYNEYFKYFSKSRSYKTNKIQDPKENAIKLVKQKDILKTIYRKDTFPSIRQVVNVYTAFFRCIENSSIGPFDRQEYLDYLFIRFSDIIRILKKARN